MKTKLIIWLATIFLLGTVNVAQAAISCLVSSPGITTSYEGALVIAQSSFTINCTRALSDPGTTEYSLRPNHGINGSGAQNNAAFVAQLLPYKEYKDSGCVTQWRATGNAAGAFEGTATFINTSATVNGSFWVCINAGETYSSGLYIDTVTMTLSYNNGTGNKLNASANDTHPISINTVPSCTISSAPGNLNFSYTAFQGTASTASTSFSTTCTTSLGYSMSVTAASGVASGVNYGLNLNTSASGGSIPLGSVGTGAQQTFYINGSAPAAQAGTCGASGCSASQSHSLIITF